MRLPLHFASAYDEHSLAVADALERERALLATLSRDDYDEETYEALMYLFLDAALMTNEAQLAEVRRLTGLTRQRAEAIAPIAPSGADCSSGTVRTGDGAPPARRPNCAPWPE